jgi:tRNA (Guanine37-N(1)-) methyltransferase (EC 2.1.1.31)
VYENERVPEVLLSGNHAAIRRWRLKQSLGRTWLRRPDLLAARALSKTELKLLDEFRQEQAGTETHCTRRAPEGPITNGRHQVSTCSAARPTHQGRGR